MTLDGLHPPVLTVTATGSMGTVLLTWTAPDNVPAGWEIVDWAVVFTLNTPPPDLSPSLTGWTVRAPHGSTFGGTGPLGPATRSFTINNNYLDGYVTHCAVDVGLSDDGTPIPTNKNNWSNIAEATPYSAGSPGSSLAASPSHLEFSMSSSDNPADQNVSITSTGSTALDWIVGADAPWLSTQIQSGTTPSTLTVSADGSGLESGTYTATITLSEVTAPPPPPTPKPIDPTGWELSSTEPGSNLFDDGLHQVLTSGGSYASAQRPSGRTTAYNAPAQMTVMLDPVTSGSAYASIVCYEADRTGWLSIQFEILASDNTLKAIYSPHYTIGPDEWVANVPYNPAVHRYLRFNLLTNGNLEWQTAGLDQSYTTLATQSGWTAPRIPTVVKIPQFVLNREEGASGTSTSVNWRYLNIDGTVIFDAR